MKSHHIPPFIKAGLTIITIAALWLGIREYTEVKNLTQDSCLAVLRMTFMLSLVYGSSYLMYLAGQAVMPRLFTCKPICSDTGMTVISSGRYEDMAEEEKRKNADNMAALMDSIVSYASHTFDMKLKPNQTESLCNNIRLLSEGRDTYCGVSSRMDGVTSNDLYHFGWNIGKRLKRTNIQIALFLKGTFVTMLEDVSVDTVQTKLAIKEGNFSLKLIPLGQDLVPHIFPDTIGIENA